MTGSSNIERVDVIIVDTQGGRGGFLTRLFASIGRTSRHYSGTSWRNEHGSNVDPPASSRLAIIHHADLGFFADDKYPSAARLFYSGLVPSNADSTWLQRHVEENSITKEEAKELCSWIEGGQQGDLPALMRVDNDLLDWLTALTILCQAYLCRHAEAATPAPPTEPAVVQALERMGWRPNNRVLRQAVALRDIESAAWWRRGLAVDPKGAPKDLSAMVKVGELLSAVKSDAPLMPALIADAYLEIANRLETIG